jgi:hypothetical protein
MINFWHRADKNATIGKNWSDINVIFDRISGILDQIYSIPWFQIEALCEAKETKGEKEDPLVTSVPNSTSTLD